MKTIEPRDDAQRQVERHRRGRTDGSSPRDRIVITATVAGVIAFVLIGIPFLKRDLPNEGRPVAAAGDLNADPDRDAVREWLHANYADPHPREIRWWPARTLDDLHRKQLLAAKDAAEDSGDDDPELRDYAEQLERNGPDRVCRLKFYTKNEVGALIRHDELFTLRGGRVRLVPGDTTVADAMRKYFPEDGGQP
ncbi:MAG TPA: hypothetical protein VEI07_10940 [Planctomycetaceae bacterium]|nr:hypothetical protein [Planctomycetaceae bacterium]